MSHYSNPSNSVVIRIPRSDLRPGDVILGPASPSFPIARRPRYTRYRTRSLDRGDDVGSYGEARAITRRNQDDAVPYRGRGDASRGNGQGRDCDDSEGSVPPQGRRPRNQNRNRDGAKKNVGSSSSSSSSDLGCTDDDEKEKKKAKLKKWGAVGLAGIATIHAVHGVHESLEKAKKRRAEVAHGDISEGEAESKKGKSRWRDAANVGIAGIWIKGAYDEIKEYREAKHEHAEMIERAEERHKKRLERAKATLKGGCRREQSLPANGRRRQQSVSGNGAAGWRQRDDDSDDDFND